MGLGVVVLLMATGLVVGLVLLAESEDGDEARLIATSGAGGPTADDPSASAGAGDEAPSPVLPADPSDSPDGAGGAGGAAAAEKVVEVYLESYFGQDCEAADLFVTEDFIDDEGTCKENWEDLPPAEQVTYTWRVRSGTVDEDSGTAEVPITLRGQGEALPATFHLVDDAGFWLIDSVE